MTHKGAVTCAVCPASAWLVTFLIGSVSTGVVTWSALRCGASGESGKKVAAAPLSKTAAAAAAAKTWFAKHPLDYMLHNRFPWKRSGRRSSMWPPYSLRRNLSAAACRPCDRSMRHRRWHYSLHTYFFLCIQLDATSDKLSTTCRPRYLESLHVAIGGTTFSKSRDIVASFALNIGL